MFKTDWCLSYGTKKDKKYKTMTLSLVLNETTKNFLKSIINQCQKHLKPKELNDVLYGQKENIIYVKIRDSTRLFKNNKVINNPLKLEEVKCKVKAVLVIEGLTLGKKNNLQIGVYDAKVKDQIYGYQRQISTDLDNEEVISDSENEY